MKKEKIFSRDILSHDTGSTYSTHKFIVISPLGASNGRNAYLGKMGMGLTGELGEAQKFYTRTIANKRAKEATGLYRPAIPFRSAELIHEKNQTIIQL